MIYKKVLGICCPLGRRDIDTDGNELFKVQGLLTTEIDRS